MKSLRGIVLIKSVNRNVCLIFTGETVSRQNIALRSATFCNSTACAAPHDPTEISGIHFCLLGEEEKLGIRNEKLGMWEERETEIYAIVVEVFGKEGIFWKTELSLFWLSSIGGVELGFCQKRRSVFFRFCCRY